jgi:hypothetical protein
LPLIFIAEQVDKSKASAGGNTSLPAHPEGQTPATKQYAEQLVKFLAEKSGAYNMSKIGLELKRPDGAQKIGKIMKAYPTWFRRSGDKGELCRHCPWFSSLSKCSTSAADVHVCDNVTNIFSGLRLCAGQEELVLRLKA